MSCKALIVGVNKYKLPGSDLQGCVNDATNIRDILLKYYGFSISSIRVLTDDRATKKAIMDRLNWLVKDAKAGDKLLFHFSGHGSQIRDRDGDELKDHLDEIICPHDMDWDGTYIFSGCKDTQTSADAYIKGTYNGAFTYYFCKTLRNVQGHHPRRASQAYARLPEARRLQPDPPVGMPDSSEEEKTSGIMADYPHYEQQP